MTTLPLGLRSRQFDNTASWVVILSVLTTLPLWLLSRQFDNTASWVIAFICGLIVIILMIMALASTDWLMATGWRQGLFIHCIAEGAPTPLPFNMQDPPGCYQARDVCKYAAFNSTHSFISIYKLSTSFPIIEIVDSGRENMERLRNSLILAYIQAAAALCIITLITDIVATLLTGLGLRSKDHMKKYKYYKIAVYVMVLSLISILIALVIYPVCFVAEYTGSKIIRTQIVTHIQAGPI
uniref:Uncharacterized protein n=1 Tax=Timema cristinae TaxID=61476 RepID=A0A7R9D6K4_TIMCR|nr:unnamed protein product [Timema cristinae]